MKKVKYITIRTAALLLLGAVMLSATAFAVDLPDVTAQYAFLCDPKTGEVLFQKNADTRAHPASLTKIMTALIVIEEADLSDVTTVSDAALDALDPASSIAGLMRGEEVTVDILLKMLLVASANDAANVLAEHMYGSVDGFVARMNARADEIGCTNTNFKNAHGLTDEGHYTSARDMYMITIEALKYPIFLEICNTASLTVPASNMRDEQVYYTTNHLISSLKTPDYLYHYAKGIKTGHTTPAGYCLVSGAEKNGLYLVGVVMKSEREADTNRQMSFVDSKTLYEWAFDNFSMQTMLEKSTAIAEIHVSLSSETDFVTLVPSAEITALLPREFDQKDVELVKTITSPDGVDAPVTRGEVMGSLTVRWNGRDYGTVDLVALTSVSLDKTLQMGRDVKDFFAQQWVLYLILAIVALIFLYIVFIVTLNSRRRKARRKGGYRNGRR